MTEQVEEQVQPEERQEEIQDQIEQIAADIGWNKDFEGDNAVDAKTYILRSKDINKTMAKKVKALSRELDAMKEGFSTMKSHFDALRESEVGKLKSEIDRLKKERDDAAEEGDTSRYKRTNEQIDKLQGEVEKAKESPKANAPQGPPKEYLDWVESGNEWYEEDTDMQTWANNLARTPEYNALPYKTLLTRLSEKAKEVFPEKFQTEPPEPSAAAVASPTPKTKKGKKATANMMTYEQKMVAKDFVAQGVVKSMDEYAQMLQEQGRI